ncbi:MAG: hypothetical protein EBR53_00140 [Actinobacteria bacterium]|jgi:hypothetical protein|nr:hypothetical protein [Actinomycetota bacterium]
MKVDMGIKDVLKISAKPVREIDAERLVDRFAKLRLNPISELEARDRTKVCGEVKRMTIKPRSGIPSMEIVINDGTGDATVIFSGRRHVAGIEHGHCIVVEGVAFADGNRLVFLNPAYSLLPTSED